MNTSLSKLTLILTVMFMDLLAGMEFDIFVPSFPELQNQFHLSAFWVESLLSINFIGYCTSIIFIGGLADRYGRKPIILFGLIIFILSSILCLCASSFKTLLVGRFFQGVGVAAPAILSYLIIADAYSLKKQQFILAMLNVSFNVAIALAPVLGSYITIHFHWQGNFVALLILALIIFVMTILFISSPTILVYKDTLSLKGYYPIFKSKALMLLIMNSVFTFVPYWIFVGMAPLLYINDLDVPLSHFGFYQGTFAFVFALGSLLFGLAIRKNNYNFVKALSMANKIIILSMIVIIVATIVNTHNPLIVTLAFLPYIVTQVIPSNILYPVCINYIPQAKAKISALMQGFRLLFSALSLQVTSYFYQGSFQNIGIILIVFIFITIITLALVINNQEITNKLKEAT